MDYNDFKEFFKVHVKQYGPYRDSILFQSFSNFLMDSYYNESYIDIPSSFKSAFEQQVLDSEYVMPFLLSLGIPSSEIEKISSSDRFKIVNAISDFHRYKGTITLIDNLVSNFDVNDNMAVYELYLDMHIDANGIKVWDVLPKLIKSSIGARPTLELTSALPFSVLDSASNWLIDEVTLGDLYDNGEMQLPYKTNCILLDSTILNRINPIIQIVSTLVLETLKDEKVRLFFSDGIYITTFSNINILWYYIFHKLHSVGNASNLNKNTIDGSALFSRYEIPNVDGTLPRGGSNILTSPLTNIQVLIDSYANLSTSDSDSGIKISEFYDLYIDAFSTFNFSKNSTFAQYRVSIISMVGEELISYIDNRLDTAANPANEGNLILSEIYNSILTYKSLASTPMDMDYLSYYFLNLPGLIKDIKNSTTYIMLNLLKPYHTDLLDNRNQKVIEDSTFNNALVSYSQAFGTMYTKVIKATHSDNSVHAVTTANIYDNMAALNLSIFDIIYNSLYDPTIATALHRKLFKSVTENISADTISEFLKIVHNTIANDNLPITEVSAIILSVLNKLIVIYDDNVINLISSDAVTIATMNDASSQISLFKNYEYLPIADIVPHYIYDNPTTGVHTVYNS